MTTIQRTVVKWIIIASSIYVTLGIIIAGYFILLAPVINLPPAVSVTQANKDYKPNQKLTVKGYAYVFPGMTGVDGHKVDLLLIQNKEQLNTFPALLDPETSMGVRMRNPPSFKHGDLVVLTGTTSTEPELKLKLLLDAQSN